MSRDYLPHQHASNVGVKPVESAPYEHGASSPRSSAMTYRNNITQQQTDNNKSFGGKKMRRNRRSRKHKGGIGPTVPSFSSPGPTVSSGSQTATGASVASNTTNTQSAANAACDKCIGAEASASHVCQSPACNPQSGGSGCSEGVGLVGPNQSWGCMSGGKKHRHSKKSTHKRKLKKSRKSKMNKSKKTHKSKKSKNIKKMRKTRHRKSKK